ncbi:hypothetical protein BD410DRAFT_735054 [Rickenella mellea]|uniref:CxC2-like cysteine cluster KDZ transposase-associated domain-containing protein n=1 Tax=Rickenella mellea TaxID=50990 RepID=A0A4Y7PF46_9AGAM|nr:hypothetical protein BD410DRAFT_735054 [Rickenella mellea]
MREWAPLRDKYLQEFLRLDGRREFASTTCSVCKVGLGDRQALRCKDCFTGDLSCAACCVAVHAANPLHNVERWNGEFFEATSLHDYGLRVQLGHARGSTCTSPRPAPCDFTVIHTNGIHVVTVDYCACRNGDPGDRIQQLLRREWFPASQIEPQTCCTFSVLDLFHVMTLQSKVSAYDFYSALAKLTDMTGLREAKDRYRSFLRIARQYRHLLLLKRGGRGHLGGVAGTGPGELAVICPACPRPGINLPDSWEQAPAEKRYLYSQIVTIDACFRMKRRNVSSREKDPGLGTGMAYFVEEEPYREWLARHKDQNEISTCTGLAALDHANTKFSGGLECTGVGAVQCRHEMQMRNGVGDLQKGERFCNMDFVFASAMRHFREGPKVVSYDISCQWSIRLASRLENLPDWLYFEVDGVRYAIPKFHIGGHLVKCQGKYSLNYMPGVGRTDGENIERGWSKIEGAAGSTKEMGPGARHDTLDDHWGFLNWMVFVSFGITLRRKILAAVVELREQTELFEDFTARMEPNDVAEWTATVEAWEADTSQPNPYVAESKGISEASVRLQLAQEEAEATEAEPNSAARHVTASAFLAEGLAIEEQQSRLLADTQVRGPRTPSENVNIIERRTALIKRIARFREIQVQHMVVPAGLSDGEASVNAELIDLGLPSSIPAENRGFSCSQALVTMEVKLREAQCFDSLAKLRHRLHVKSGLVKYKQRNVRHQAPNTRARGLLNRNDAKIKLYSTKYRRARAAKFSLVGPGDWEQELQVLADDDIRAISASVAGEVPNPRPSEGRHRVSWLWIAPGTQDGDANGLNEALRIEWAKARARVARWSEEVELLREEMRRVLATLRFQAGWWLDKKTEPAVSNLPECAREGAAAYASKQSALFVRLSNHFEGLWVGLRDGRRDANVAESWVRNGKKGRKGWDGDMSSGNDDSDDPGEVDSP